jgi:hypothetical protein
MQERRRQLGGERSGLAGEAERPQDAPHDENE